MAYDIGPRIGIEGEKEFRQAIQGINTNLKTLGTEMLAVTSQFDKNDKSMSALTSQNKVLNKQIDEQKTKLSELEKGLKASAEKYGENDKVTQGWQQAVNKATADLNKMQRELDDNTAAMNKLSDEGLKFSEKMKKVSEGLDDFGKKAVQAGKTMTTTVTAPIVAAGGAAFKFAADLQDAMGASDQIFKGSSGIVQAWADSLNSAYGIAETDALTYANTMGAMLQNIGGLTEDEAAKQSQILVQLAGDLTAMFGGTTESAVQALTGALKGNNSMLDNYGMGVNEATIKTKALEMGLIAEGETLDLAGKQAATLALIMEQTADAQGQAAREADGASGSMRGLTTELKNIATDLGEILLPIITPFIQKLSEMVTSFKNLSPETQEMIVKIAGLAAAIGPALLVVGKLSSGISSVIGVVDAAKTAIGAGKGLAGVLTAVAGPAGPVLAVVAVIGILVAAGIALYKNWDTIKEKLLEFKNYMSQIWENIKTNTVEAFNNIKTKITETIVGLAKSALGWGKNIVEGLWDGIDSLKGWIKEKVLGFVEGIGNTIKDFFGINSPSTLMAEYGQYIDEGLAKGITDNAEAPLNAMTAITTAISDSVTGTISEMDRLAARISNFDSQNDSEKSAGRSNRKKEKDNFYVTNKDEIDAISKRQGVDLSVAQEMLRENLYSGIPKYARGTKNHPGGLALLGELGPELVNLPRGSQVYTNQESKNMTRPITLNLNIGTLVADDYGLKQLERKLSRIRIDENFRLGVVNG